MMKAFKMTIILVLTLLLVVPGTLNLFAIAGEQRQDFPSRDGEEDLQMKVGSVIPITETKMFNNSFYYPVPEGATVTSADMSISVHPFTEDGRDYPEDVVINFAKGIREYEFNNEELVFQGAWGRNYQTTDGAVFNAVQTTGGPMKLRFAFPKNATLIKATIDINGSQRSNEFNITKTNLTSTGSHFGELIKVLGDTNGDGIEEVLVGAPNDNVGAGRVYHLSYPLPEKPVVFASTTQSKAFFGSSISSVFQYSDTASNAVAIGAPNDEIGNLGTVKTFSYSPGASPSTYDVKLLGNNSGEGFGASVAACDLDEDKSIELFVGAPDANGGVGVVYMFEINSTTATLVTVINGTTGELHFGRDITTGDMDSDGIEDLIISSDDYVRIFISDPNWDLISDLTIDPLGDSGESEFGKIEFLGDTGEGVGTLGIGVPTQSAGSILLYDGGLSLDSVMDKELAPGVPVQGFGTGFSSGDLDNDNSNEIIVGSPGTSSWQSSVLIMKRTSSNPWKSIPYTGLSTDMFGYSVGIANLRGTSYPDPFGDIIIGSPQFFGTSSTGPGEVSLYEYYDIDSLTDNKPMLKIDTDTIWTFPGDKLSGTVTSVDMSTVINNYLSSKTADYSSDFEGFVYLDLTFDSIAADTSEGSDSFNLTNFDFRYDQTIDFENLEGAMNNYILNFDESMKIINGQKFVPVPLSVTAKAPGNFRIEAFDVEVDEIPYVEYDPEEIHVPEDSHDDKVIDLYTIFADNVTSDPYLNISVGVEDSKKKFVDAYITQHRYLGVDLTNKTDDMGRNWSGEIGLIFTVDDFLGGRFIYSNIKLVVDEVNDAPALKDTPSEFVYQDSMFIFSPSKIDDEGDEINITLDFSKCPINMSVDYTTGTISWKPNKWEVGFVNFTVILSDGIDERTYTFPLEVKDEPDNPVFLTQAPDPSTQVLVGTTFIYNFSATDPDIGDRVTYIIVFPVQGAGIDVQTGHFTWTPPQHYPFPIEFVVRARDVDGHATDLKFSLNTSFTDSSPILRTNPRTALFDTEEWVFHLDVFDAEENRIEIELVEGPEGLEYNDVVQNLTWIPDVEQIGEFNLSIKLSSTVFVQYYNYTLSVERSQRYWTFKIQGLKDGQSLKGKVQIGGELVLTPSTIRTVEVKVGDSDWVDGLFSEGRWSYNLNTNDYKDGKYLIQVRAWDGAIYSDIESVTVKIENDEESTSPIIFIIIALVILAIIGLAVGGFFLFRRIEEKKQEDELERQRQEAIEASKKSMDEFIQKTGSDLDRNIDYSSVEVDETDQSDENFDRIDEIFQPLNIPKEDIPEGDYELPEDPLLHSGPALMGSLPIDTIPEPEEKNDQQSQPEVDLPDT